jgi:hypothetical protein
MRRIKQLLHCVEDLDACTDDRHPFEIPDIGMAGCVSSAVIDALAKACYRFRPTSWTIAGSVTR